MALGGGTWLTQNKLLPGTYINFVNTNTGGAILGERGTVAIALPLSADTSGTIIELNSNDFSTKASEILGASVDPKIMKALREIFRNAQKVIIVNNHAPEEGQAPNVAKICSLLEPYDFNILACYTNTQSDIDEYVKQIKRFRDDIGKKCQGVVYNATTKPDYEGIINVVTTVSDSDSDPHSLVAWVSGLEANCPVNATCTNKLYNGEFNIKFNGTQEQLETNIKNGEFAFHNVYGEIRVLEDINSLTTTSATKGEDLKNNQTIRVCDQIANDIARLFNTKYLGLIPNDNAGRTSLWGDIVKHHRELETMRAIENYDASQLTVQQGDSKKSVIINDVITVINGMSQLYMTVIVQ